MTRDAAESGADRYRIIFEGARLAPLSVPRLQLLAWRDALSHAKTIDAVIDVVQKILRARFAHASSIPSCWQPRDIRSREDIEHWARRIRARPPGRPAVDGLAAVGELMRFALERMNELGPRRGASARTA